MGADPLAGVVHLATILTVLVLTPTILWRRRGDRRHRLLRRIWVGAMALTAVISFGLRFIGHGRFSVIHLLSVFVLIQRPIIVMAARRGDYAKHRKAIRGMAIGTLLIAGSFTFPFGRLLGHWLFG